jgi:hypothetical protein
MASKLQREDQSRGTTPDDKNWCFLIDSLAQSDELAYTFRSWKGQTINNTFKFTITYWVPTGK